MSWKAQIGALERRSHYYLKVVLQVIEQHDIIETLEAIMLRILNTLPKPKRGQSLYCNCQKEQCFPCQQTAVVLANTEDGSLQLCRDCKREYA